MTVYLEHSGTKFWRCIHTSAKKVTLSFGKCGSEGRTMVKTDFKNRGEAETYFEKQVQTKRKAGYVDASDPKSSKKKPSSTAGKRKKSENNKNVAGPVAKKSNTKKAGLKGHAAPDMVGGKSDKVDVDTGVSQVNAALASRSKVHETFNARLAHVDVSKNSDRYYILQVLVDEKKKSGKKKSSGPDHYLFTRWGRTGTSGQGKLDGPFADEEEVELKFAKQFQSKTGVQWKKAVRGAAPKAGKYEYLERVDSTSKEGSWYYYLTNDPLGKCDGWYEYESQNSAEVEELYSDYHSAKKVSRLALRQIHSESSGFTYGVDLSNLTQCNTKSSTVRPIGRTITGKKPKGKPPAIATRTPIATPVTSSTYATPVYSKSTPVKSPVVSAAVRSLISNADVSAGSVDPAASSALQGGSIHADYNTMLNQTNLSHNNNKFYKIQLIQISSGLHLFTKWGRVGESGATQELGPLDSTAGINEFKKKFKNKTGNDWTRRSNFVSKTGKYDIVEMEEDADEAKKMAACSAVGTSQAPSSPKYSPCTLDDVTKKLVDLIFNEDMFKTAMSAMNLDPNKLPLGALSKNQIARGFAALESIETELNGKAAVNKLMDLTSNFYTAIPHSFGRSRGPVLSSKVMVDEKYEMLNTLTDIEAAQSMQRNNNAKESGKSKTVTHPTDSNYQQLLADLTLLEKKDADRKVIETYLANTKSSGMRLRDVWSVNRHNESKRYAAHDDISNRRLLWHGTNVAVVAAILKGGLRIMPHSGGRVGRGIYLADQHQKSAWYVRSSRGTIIMFLVEAALGKEHIITSDDSSLTCAPPGYDSVLAKGTTAPHNGKDVEMEIDGKSVKVPQSKPVQVKSANGSSFGHNEFLVYKESQHRIRYILTFDE